MELALSKALTRQEEVRDLFRKLDVDKDGFLDKDELRALMHNLGFGSGMGGAGPDKDGSGFESFLDMKFRKGDTSGDGKVDFEEFVELHNNLLDAKKRLDHFNFAISLLIPDECHDMSPDVFEKNIEVVAQAHANLDRVKETIADSHLSGEVLPSSEVLQAMSCVLILFGLPQGESPADDWVTACKLFDAPNFVEDLQSFDVMKLRRTEVEQASSRAASLLEDFETLAASSPVAHALLSWVVVTVARAKKLGQLDVVPKESCAPQRRSSFAFDVGTTERKGVWRVRDSEDFTGNFHRKKEGHTAGVTLQVGRLHDTLKESVAAVWFDRTVFTEEKAQAWWEEHRHLYVDKDGLLGTEEHKTGTGVNSKSGTKEQWGYDEDGNFVNLSAVSGLQPENDVMKSARGHLQNLTSEDLAALGNLEDEPRKGTPVVCIIACLLGEATDALAEWDGCRKFVARDDLLEALAAIDLRNMSRKILRERVRAAKVHLLDPDVSTSGLKNGSPTIQGLFQWSSSVIIASDDPEVVTAGRLIDTST